MKTQHKILLLALAVVAGYVILRQVPPGKLPWNSSPITVPGGHYGGGQ